MPGDGFTPSRDARRQYTYLPGGGQDEPGVLAWVEATTVSTLPGGSMALDMLYSAGGRLSRFNSCNPPFFPPLSLSSTSHLLHFVLVVFLRVYPTGFLGVSRWYKMFLCLWAHMVNTQSAPVCFCRRRCRCC